MNAIGKTGLTHHGGGLAIETSGWISGGTSWGSATRVAPISSGGTKI